MPGTIAEPAGNSRREIKPVPGRYEWTPTQPADEVRVFVRAINGEGERQIEQFRDQVPHGSTGLHWVRGRVDPA